MISRCQLIKETGCDGSQLCIGQGLEPVGGGGRETRSLNEQGAAPYIRPEGCQVAA